MMLRSPALLWQLGSLPGKTLALMRVTAWGFACGFAAVTVLSVAYLFWIPIVMSSLITVSLSAAAWRSGKS